MQLCFCLNSIDLELSGIWSASMGFASTSKILPSGHFLTGSILNHWRFWPLVLPDTYASSFSHLQYTICSVINNFLE